MTEDEAVCLCKACGHFYRIAGREPTRQEREELHAGGLGPRRRAVTTYRSNWILIPALLLFLAGSYAYVNPHFDFPVVSHAVCGIKGGQWYQGGLFGPAGCYSQVTP